MLKYRKVLMLLAVLFAIITTLIGHQLMIKMLNKEKKEDYVQIPVAIEEIQPLMLIGEDSIGYIAVPSQYASQFPYIVDKNKIVGKITISKIAPNTPFFEQNLFDLERDAPFHLAEGYRAVSFESDAVASVGGHLKAGMYVDVLWTQTADGKINTAVPFQNIEVLAVGGPSNIGSGAGNESNTITLKMELKEAQQLTYMTHTGKIALILRPSPEEGEQSIEPFTIPVTLT